MLVRLPRKRVRKHTHSVCVKSVSSPALHCVINVFSGWRWQRGMATVQWSGVGIIESGAVKSSFSLRTHSTAAVLQITAYDPDSLIHSPQNGSCFWGKPSAPALCLLHFSELLVCCVLVTKNVHLGLIADHDTSKQTYKEPRKIADMIIMEFLMCGYSKKVLRHIHTHTH